MTALSDLTSKLEKTNFVANVKAIVSTLGLFPDSWDDDRDSEPKILSSVAEVVTNLWNGVVWYAIAAGFLDLATGGWLTLLAKNVYFVDRIPASYAAGVYAGANATTSPIGPFNPGDLVFVNLDTGKTYRNIETVTFAKSATTNVNIAAEDLGTAGNGVATRVVLQTTVLGISGSNPATFSGRDEETDPELRARCRLKPASLSACGPAAAYEYVCLTPDFHGVAVNRVKISNGSPNGTVDILIAGPSGAVAPDDVTAVDAAVAKNVTPDAVTSSVTSATAHPVDVTWQGWTHNADLDTDEAEAAANAALAAAFRAMRIGGEEKVAGSGFVFKGKLADIVALAVPDFFDVAVTSPAADVAIASNEVPTLGTPLGTVTVAP